MAEKNKNRSDTDRNDNILIGRNESGNAGENKGGLSADNGSVVIGGNVQGSNIVIGNNNVVMNKSANLMKFFDEINDAVDAKVYKRGDKTDVKAELQEIKAELEKPEPDEGFLARRFRNIKRMSPEIVDIAIKTLQNPIGGVAEVVKRIARKMAEEAA